MTKSYKYFLKNGCRTAWLGSTPAFLCRRTRNLVTKIILADFGGFLVIGDFFGRQYYLLCLFFNKNSILQKTPTHTVLRRGHPFCRWKVGHSSPWSCWYPALTGRGGVRVHNGGRDFLHFSTKGDSPLAVLRKISKKKNGSGVLKPKRVRWLMPKTLSKRNWKYPLPLPLFFSPSLRGIHPCLLDTAERTLR